MLSPSRSFWSMGEALSFFSGVISAEGSRLEELDGVRDGFGGGLV